MSVKETLLSIKSDLDYIFELEWDKMPIGGNFPSMLAERPNVFNIGNDGLIKVVWERLIAVDESFKRVSPAMEKAIRLAISVSYIDANFGLSDKGKREMARHSPTFVYFLNTLNGCVYKENLETNEDREFLKKIRTIVREIDAQLERKQKLS